MKLKDLSVEQDIIYEANLMMEMINLTPDETDKGKSAPLLLQLKKIMSVEEDA